MKQNTQCCYSCNGCKVVDKICTIRNMVIKNIYKDVCEHYSERSLEMCELCKSYQVDLKAHVRSYHKITFQEYKIMIQDANSQKIKITRRELF